jgi:N-acetylglutamate synthase-like GNAT family acetyltransferase
MKKTFEKASLLINSYAKEGLMLSMSKEDIEVLFRQGRFCFLFEGGELVACAGVTAEFPGGIYEFGSWAVRKDLVSKGYGLQVYHKVMSLDFLKGKKVIAFGNKNSSPIFEKVGMGEMPQSSLPKECFFPCKTCFCDKSLVLEGELCVDRVFLLKNPDKF